MRKYTVKKELFLLALCLLAALSAFGLFVRGKSILDCPALSAEKAENLQKTEGEADRIDLFLEGRKLPADKESGVFCLPQSLAEEWEGRLDAQVDGLAAPICLSEGSWQDKARALREGDPLSAYVKVGTAWQEVQISVTALPVLEIHTEKFYSQLGEEGYGTLRVFDMGAEDAGERFLETPISYHVRGFGSLTFAKKNYKISLLDEQGGQANASILGLREDDDWRLYSLAADETLCKEKAVCDLWNQWAELTGQPKTNEIEYLELYLDGEYRGVYGIAAPLDQKTYGLTEEDRLYKLAKNVDLWVPWALNTLEGEQITNWDDRLMVEWPKEYVEKIWEPMSNYASQLWWKEGTESDKAQTEQFADLDNLVDVALYKQWIYAIDGMSSNQLYLWKAQNGKIQRVLYDTDTVLGADSRPDTYRDMEEMAADLLVDRELKALCQMDPEGTVLLAQQRWTEMSGEIFRPEYLCSLLEENRVYLEATGGLAHNRQRWKNTRTSTDGTRESISLEETEELIYRRWDLAESWIGQGLYTAG